LLADLGDDAIEAHWVVAADRALLFLTEDPPEIVGADGHEGARRIHRRSPERRVGGREEVLAQILVATGSEQARHPVTARPGTGLASLRLRCALFASAVSDPGH